MTDGSFQISKPKMPNLRLIGKEYCSVCLTEQADNLAGCPQCFGLVLEAGRWVQSPHRGIKPKPEVRQPELLPTGLPPTFPD